LHVRDMLPDDAEAQTRRQRIIELP
jgi:hypothetical protein